MNRAMIAAGAISAFLAVGAGAFAAHALKRHLSPGMLETFKTVAQYQFLHALAILAAAIARPGIRVGYADTACWLFLVGTALFSGSLYALAITGIGWLGAITPLGGGAFLAGWLALALAALRTPSKSP
jgi:uncharacterized membrane protein YgdD (TMEM256/DUF423 family)